MLVKILIPIVFVSASLFSSTAMANGSPQGHAVTLWWLFYNNPDACISDPHGGSERCGIQDVFGQAFLDSEAAGTPDPSLISPNIAAGLGVVYATGGVTDRRGRITLSASAYLSNGMLSLSPDEGDTMVDPMGLGTAFENTGAEVHLVVRDHGPVIAGQVVTQISNFLEPNCSDPRYLFEAGPNLCQDVQFAVFGPDEEGTDSVFAFDHDNTVRGAQVNLQRNGDMVQAIIETIIPLCGAHC
ncbi:MAG: hypothetical protein ACI88A_000347 [Paraglaciecola sp.]|jgi:hypothetical protein